MDLLMNGLLTAATLFAGSYCWVLARRVRDLKSLDKGLGGAIVTMTRQIELARLTLDEARASAKETRQDLTQLVARADGAAGQLKLLIAAAPTTPPPAARPAPATPVAATSLPVEPPPAPGLRIAEPQPVPPITAMIAPVIAAVHPTPEPEPEIAGDAPAETPRPAGPHLVEIPKPRALAPIENPLRRARGAAGPARSEDDILEALTALAGGR